MRMFDNAPLTDEELQIFKYHIKEAKRGSLLSFMANDKCIANALCCVGSYRRQPRCGTFVNRISDRLTKAVHREFTEEELESIVRVCLDDENNNETIRTILPEEIVKKLSVWVPVFISRNKNFLKDFLND